MSPIDFIFIILSLNRTIFSKYAKHPSQINNKVSKVRLV